MSELNKENFAKYASLKTQEKEIKEGLSSLSILIMDEMGDLDKVKATDIGTFTIASRKNWTYSDSVQSTEKELKETKKEEEKTGAATFESGAPYIIFKEE